MPTKTRALLIDRNTGALIAKGKEALARVEHVAFPLAPLNVRNTPFYVRAFQAWRNAPVVFRQQHVLHVYRERRKGKSTYKRMLDTALRRRLRPVEYHYYNNGLIDAALAQWMAVAPPR